MKSSNYLTVLLLPVLFACVLSLAHANSTIPDVDANDFDVKQGVIVINSENTRYLSILARKNFVIDQIQFKKQKYLSLKSKKILVSYLRRKKPNINTIQIQGLHPQKYWEDGKYSYLISVIRYDNIEMLDNCPKKRVKKPKTNQNSSTREEPQKSDKMSAFTNSTEDDGFDYPKNCSTKNLKHLYQKLLKKGDIKNANKIFEMLQNNSIGN